MTIKRLIKKTLLKFITGVKSESFKKIEVKTAKPTKQIILHVGLHKTGTSSIQKFLQVNKEQLKKHGVDVISRSKVRAQINWLPPAIKSGTKENLAKSRNFLRSNIAKSNNEKLIFTAEEFSHLNRNHILTLKKMLPKSVDIKIIIYLRRQDSLKQSVYSQLIKQTSNHASINKLKHYKYDFFEHCSKWELLTSDIVVRPFEREQFYNNDLYRDFVHVMGIEWQSEFIIPNNSNIRPSYDILELKRRLNLHPSTHKFGREIARNLNKFDAERNTRPPEKNLSLLSFEQSKLFLDQYHETNQQVATKYLNKSCGVLFTKQPTPDIELVNIKLTKPLCHQALRYLRQSGIKLHKDITPDWIISQQNSITS